MVLKFCLIIGDEIQEMNGAVLLKFVAEIISIISRYPISRMKDEG